MGRTIFDEEAGDADDFGLDILEDRGIDPAETELRTLIEDLSEEAQIDLAALAWLGRDGGDWPELWALAVGWRKVPAVDYLRSMPMLAKNLREGLAALEELRGDATGGQRSWPVARRQF